MTTVEKQLLGALLELEETVAALPSMNPKPSLIPLFGAIDELTTQLPSDSDPQLHHYLKKRSYQKARLFLQGREAENTAGSCGHV